MAEEQITKTAVQLHKRGNANELIFATTKGELVELANGQTLEQKIPSLENVIEVVKIGTTALVVGSDKTVTIPEFYSKTDADSQFATKDEVSAIPKFGIEVVESLPTSNIKTDKIYLVITGDEEDNLFTEYIRVNNKWEKLGTQRIDISGKQDALTKTQLAAVNSGVTAEKVAAYDAYATNKQDKLSDAQLAAANSGITSDKVSTYDGYATGKQNALSDAQLAAANSGVTAEKVAAYDAYATNKQNALSDVQLAAANSGITSDKVSKYDGYESTINGKADASTVNGLEYLEYTIIRNLA